MASYSPVPGQIAPGRLTKLYADTKISSNAVFQQQPINVADFPELDTLHGQFRIQKDRLVAWGLDWVDTKASEKGNIDQSVAQAGLTETVASVLQNIKNVLDQAEKLRFMSSPTTTDAPQNVGGFLDRSVQKEQSIKRADSNTTRHEELLKDLTNSIDVLYDLSKARRMSQGSLDTKASSKQHHFASYLSENSLRNPSVSSRATTLYDWHEHNASEVTLVSPQAMMMASPHPMSATSERPRKASELGLTRLDTRSLPARIKLSQLILPDDDPPPYEPGVAVSVVRVVGQLHLNRHGNMTPSPMPQVGAITQPVLIEYATYDRIYQETGVPPPLHRLEDITGFLRHPNVPPATYCGLLELLGYFEDPRQPRIGLVYGIPIEAPSRGVPHDKSSLDTTRASRQPATLLSLLMLGSSRSAQPVASVMAPTLEDRFRMALNIVSTMQCFHENRVIHGGLKSTAILFFRGKEEDRDTKLAYDIFHPYLVGFDLFDIHKPPPADVVHRIYQHPDSFSETSSVPCNLRNDLYGLGLTLLEIGLWAPLADVFKSKYSPVQFKERLQKVYASRRLASKCGSPYMRVVQQLLAVGDNEPIDDATASRIYRDSLVRLRQCCLLEDGVAAMDSLGERFSVAPTVTAEPHSLSRTGTGQESLAESEHLPGPVPGAFPSRGGTFAASSQAAHPHHRAGSNVLEELEQSGRHFLQQLHKPADWFHHPQRSHTIYSPTVSSLASLPSLSSLPVAVAGINPHVSTSPLDVTHMTLEQLREELAHKRKALSDLHRAYTDLSTQQWEGGHPRTHSISKPIESVAPESSPAKPHRASVASFRSLGANRPSMLRSTSDAVVPVPPAPLSTGSIDYRKKVTLLQSMWRGRLARNLRSKLMAEKETTPTGTSRSLPIFAEEDSLQGNVAPAPFFGSTAVMADEPEEMSESEPVEAKQPEPKHSSLYERERALRLKHMQLATRYHKAQIIQNEHQMKAHTRTGATEDSETTQAVIAHHQKCVADLARQQVTLRQPEGPHKLPAPSSRNPDQSQLREATRLLDQLHKELSSKYGQAKLMQSNVSELQSTVTTLRAEIEAPVHPLSREMVAEQCNWAERELSILKEPQRLQQWQKLMTELEQQPQQASVSRSSSTKRRLKAGLSPYESKQQEPQQQASAQAEQTLPPLNTQQPPMRTTQRQPVVQETPITKSAVEPIERGWRSPDQIETRRPLRAFTIPMAPDLLNEWHGDTGPRLVSLLERIITDPRETSSVDLIHIGETHETAKPTIFVSCGNTKRVKAILGRKFTYDHDKFDLKVKRGTIRRSKVSRQRAAMAKRSVADPESDFFYDASNPYYQQRPICGASIGAFVGEHLPPATYGGIVMVDDEPFGMTVHHMLDPPSDSEDEDYEEDAERFRLPQRSGSAAYVSSAAPHPSHEDFALFDQPLFPDVEGTELSFSEDEETDDSGDEYSSFDYESDPESMFGGSDRPRAPSVPSAPHSAAAAHRNTDGDIDGIEPGARPDLIVTQPGIDDVPPGFLPRDEDRDEDHLDSHTLGHVYASSGIRRVETLATSATWPAPSGFSRPVSHEIDWALIKMTSDRLQPYNLLQGGRRFCKPGSGVDATKLLALLSDPICRRACYRAEEDLYPIEVVPERELAALKVCSFGRSSSLQQGRIGEAMSWIKIYGRKNYSVVWHVEGGFGMGGDSGAWVVETGRGRLCGHVLAYCEQKKIAYISPMEVMFDDMKRTLRANKVWLPGIDLLLPRHTPSPIVGAANATMTNTNTTTTGGKDEQALQGATTWPKHRPAWPHAHAHTANGTVAEQAKQLHLDFSHLNFNGHAGAGSGVGAVGGLGAAGAVREPNINDYDLDDDDLSPLDSSPVSAGPTPASATSAVSTAVTSAVSGPAVAKAATFRGAPASVGVGGAVTKGLREGIGQRA